jgi:Esterase PHB depolymerase
MKTILSTVMRKATELTCTQNAIEATRLIQRALAKRPSPPEAQPPGWSLGIEQLPGEAKDGRHGGPESANESHRAAPLRRPLGEVLTLLRQGESPGFGLDAAPFLKPRKAPAVPVPDGAAFLSRSFTCEAGSRDYKVYVPSHAKSRQRPLLIMLHGCTQNPDDFALGTPIQDKR